MTVQFSVVVPTYNVERYLDEFLDSLANQSYPIADVEIVFVDDGSTDSSAEVIGAWIVSTAPMATLLSKENGGLSSARNAGLDKVTGEWVTFCDPDDVLPPDYFAVVATFIGAQAERPVHLVACRLLNLDDRTGILHDEHPLRFRFERGNHIVDLDRHPRYFHVSAASGFYRTELIEQGQLRFDPRVQPVFEDGHFTGRYLANQDRPRVAFLADAAYHYRRRGDRTSLVQESWNDAAKFTEVPRFGHLDLLVHVHAKRGAVPLWLQNIVLYDVLGYFRNDERIHSTLGNLDDEVARQFHETLLEVMSYIETATIEDFRIASVSPEVRNALIIGAKGEKLRPDRLSIRRIDADQLLVEVRYFYGGDPPREEFRARGRAISPVYAKARSITFLGKRLASERIVWLPANGTIEISIDGRRMPIDLGAEPRVRYVVGPTQMWRHLTSSPPPGYDDSVGPAVSPPPSSSRDRAIRRRLADIPSWCRESVARTRAAADVGRRFASVQWSRVMSPDARIKRRAAGFRGRRYRSAWVFADRSRLAQDNAEHLYRFVKDNHPEVNAWFVIDRDTKDWVRLERDGFKLVQHGTPGHQLLMLNCVELMSSQVDHRTVRPLETRQFGQPRWRFTFLQHGVTTADLSRWLNRKPISRMITATEVEQLALAGDDTPYVFTEKEVRLTGFPRHDRLLRLADDPRVLSADRLLLLMPTWRQELRREPTPGGDRFLGEGFWESPYAHNWLVLIESERLRHLADLAQLRIAFVPHPQMSEFLTRSYPAHVECHRYEDVDIQKLLARGAGMITDYSSNAFELAYLNRPVIYFQFDRSRFFSGRHIGRRGSWSAQTHGFGPVTERSSEVLDELQQLVHRGMCAQEPYATRMTNAFAFRDGRCCERAFESIVAARRPLPFAEAFKSAEG